MFQIKLPASEDPCLTLECEKINPKKGSLDFDPIYFNTILPEKEWSNWDNDKTVTKYNIFFNELPSTFYLIVEEFTNDVYPFGYNLKSNTPLQIFFDRQEAFQYFFDIDKNISIANPETNNRYNDEPTNPHNYDYADYKLYIFDLNDDFDEDEDYLEYICSNRYKVYSPRNYFDKPYNKLICIDKNGFDREIGWSDFL